MEFSLGSICVKMCRAITEGRSIIALAGVLCLACGHSASSPSASDVDVVGRVLDFPTGVGVSGVGVSIGEQRATTTGTGSYTIRLPIGDYVVNIDGELTPQAMMVRGPWTHGDFYVNGGACGCRYGNIVDAVTRRPLAGVAVTGGSTTVLTDADGWYRTDGGCGPCGTCNTAILTTDKSGYKPFSQVLGRGFRDVRRLDIALEKASG